MVYALFGQWNPACLVVFQLLKSVSQNLGLISKPFVRGRIALHARHWVLGIDQSIPHTNGVKGLKQH